MVQFTKQFALNVPAKCSVKSSGAAVRNMFSVYCSGCLLLTINVEICTYDLDFVLRLFYGPSALKITC